jgi:gas vesicle protein
MLIGIIIGIIIGAVGMYLFYKKNGIKLDAALTHIKELEAKLKE